MKALLQASKKTFQKWRKHLSRRWKKELESSTIPTRRDSSGIALFMVLAAMGVLSLLVTEFTYVSQVNQKMAYDGADQLRAFYMAKSAYKLSILRLKAYLQLKLFLEKMGGAASGAVPIPKGVLDKIWNFPFMFPIPSNVPGLGFAQQKAIEDFQKESAFVGSFTSVIESESSRYNLNLLLAAFIPSPKPSPTPTAQPNVTPTPEPDPSQPSPSPTPGPTFNPEAARKSLQDFMTDIFTQKLKSDEQFESLYRDTQIEDIVNEIAGWADITYEMPKGKTDPIYALKKAPFYSVTELAMLGTMDEELYNLFAPQMTANTTPGINVNTLQEPMFRALVTGVTDEEVKEFFKFRDSDEADNSFAKVEDFYNYLLKHVGAIGTEKTLNEWKQGLQKRNIYFVTDETFFKITVQGKVNQSTRTIEAWVVLSGPAKRAPVDPNNPGGNPGGAPPPGSPPVPGQKQKSDTGIRVTLMRIL